MNEMGKYIGIKNRGSQMHKNKAKYDRRTRKKLVESDNEYEFCVECEFCHKPFEPQYGEDVCPECGGKNG